MGRIYTIANQKGGVGKTTTAVNLGAFLATFGQRILLVDLDPQANASSCLGIDKRTVKNSIYDVIIGSEPAIKNILYNQRLKLSLLPSSPALVGAEVELVSVIAREIRLREALYPLIERYDYILIDCPPSLGLLTLNGVVAAKDGVIIPVQCEYLALEGIGQLNQTLSRIRTAIFPNLRVRGVVLTMFDVRTKLSADVVNEITRHFPDQVFTTIIPRSVRLAEAPSYGQPISVYAPGSNGATAYSNLAREILVGDGVLIAEPIQALVSTE
ncbi:MAG: sporulation initiation inhibitor Soj [Chloroflexi bacterium RBG_16_47_49]|nr:MAG: sporulation initiation inhibitor Soj [Chloroflexi bacterium RBG_16_47_49]